MTAFDGRTLVPGAITGVRSFRVDALGRLTGVAHPEVWAPGMNTATCEATPLTRMQLAINGMLLYGSTAANVDIGKHRPGAAGCTCGYYAYFDLGHNPHHRPEQVLALIEGTGLVTAGSRGFRAEKARVIALVDDVDRSPIVWRRGHSRMFWAQALVTLWCAIWLVAGIAVGDEWWWFGPLGVLNAWIAWREALKTRRVSGAEVPAHVSANYPDVPVFRSLKDALAVYPVVPPERPSPTSVPDFWTRRTR